MSGFSVRPTSTVQLAPIRANEAAAGVTVANVGALIGESHAATATLEAPTNALSRDRSTGPGENERLSGVMNTWLGARSTTTTRPRK